MAVVVAHLAWPHLVASAPALRLGVQRPRNLGNIYRLFFFFLPQIGSTGWLTAKPANRVLSNNIDAWSHSQSSRTMAKKYVEAAIDHLLVLIAVLFSFMSNNHLTNKAQKLSVAGFVQSN